MEQNGVVVKRRVLIVSPHFPPVNSADMHRVRQSLVYFREMGWEPVVITVDEQFIESYSLDPLLVHTFPADIEVHKVKAFGVKYTRKLGVGSLSMRSYFQIRQKGNQLMKQRKFDLIYFSTTAFHVMALGPGWKKKWNIPFVLDIQDPWRSDFYLDKPKAERPPKFFLSYNIDKYLEAYTVPRADGIISVSQGYCSVFQNRYVGMTSDRFRVIPFGVADKDFSVMEQFVQKVEKAQLSSDKINLVYVGRGGHDMKFALEVIFRAMAKGMATRPQAFNNLHLWFIGTSYAPAGRGQKTIEPIAQEYGVGDMVTEITDRIPYFETLYLLRKADLLIVPGSIDTSYTASKIYPYIVADKPLMAVFYKQSSVVEVLQQVRPGSVIPFDHLQRSAAEYAEECTDWLNRFLDGHQQQVADMEAFEPYTARKRAAEQVAFFNKIADEYR